MKKEKNKDNPAATFHKNDRVKAFLLSEPESQIK